ncbi:hypothetical protein [Bradyrhizobium semiaridum]|uniref:hypothetical protein n=1 Tax=Bradyrhizobium semiaridum TaxID=2821404 RepID=UPI001CE31C28|nr:hypothetical protein [Bradyrhizobium semiaridum]
MSIDRRLKVGSWLDLWMALTPISQYGLFWTRSSMLWIRTAARRFLTKARRSVRAISTALGAAANDQVIVDFWILSASMLMRASMPSCTRTAAFSHSVLIGHTDVRRRHFFLEITSLVMKPDQGFISLARSRLVAGNMPPRSRHDRSANYRRKS